MKKMAAIGLIFLMAISLAGCPIYMYPPDGGGNGGGGGSGNGGGGGGGGGGTVYYNELTLYNNTYAEYIIGIYLSPTYSDDWGYNQLDYVLDPGYSITIQDIPDDCYDIYIEADSGAYWEIYDYCMSGGYAYEVSLSD